MNTKVKSALEVVRSLTNVDGHVKCPLSVVTELHKQDENYAGRRHDRQFICRKPSKRTVRMSVPIFAASHCGLRPFILSMSKHFERISYLQRERSKYMTEARQ
jgi:hypothetical protein